MILMCSLVDDSWLVCWHFVLKKHLYYYLELFHFPYQGKSQHKPLWKQNLHLHYNTVIIIILTWIMVGCEKHACLESLYQVCLIQSPDVTNSNKQSWSASKNIYQFYYKLGSNLNVIIKTENFKHQVPLFKVSIFKENEERFKFRKTVVLHQKH